MTPRVLILPGWQNSGPEHWQSRWEALHGFRRVDQHDWMTPRRGDWIARLEDVILGCDGPVVLVAHSLGCILTAAWAQVSRSTGRVQGALLVAPGDPEREELRGVLPSWAPIVRERLPFPSLLLGSRNDAPGAPGAGGGGNYGDGDDAPAPRRSAPPQRPAATPQRQAAAAPKSNTGFDDMDDDIPF